MGTLSDTVTLTAGATPDASKATFTAAPASIVANDTQTSTLTLTIKDANDNAITGVASSLNVNVTDSESHTPAVGKVTVTSITESATLGTYTAAFKGQLAGTYTLKPQMNGSNIGTLSAAVTLTAGTTPDGVQSTFVATPESIEANNVAVSTLNLTMKDAYGNALSGLAANLTLNVTDRQGAAPAAGKVTLSTVTETATPGVYSATLKGILAGDYTVKPQFDGNAIGTLSDTVTLTAGVLDGAQSSFTVNPASVMANNVEASTLTFTAKDANGNVISGLASSLSIDVKNSQNSAPQIGSVTLSNLTETGVTGVYTATLKGIQADTYTVKPQLSGSNIGTLSGTVIMTAGAADGVQSAFGASPRSIVADNTALSTLTLTLKDKFGNLISGIAGNLSLEVKDSEGAAVAADKVTVSSLTETGVTGVYTATLKGTLAGDYTVKPLNNSALIGTLSTTVTLMAGTPDGTKSVFTIAPDSIVADDVTTSTLTLTAKDAKGNAITGIASALSMVVKDSHDAVPADSKVTLGAIVESASQPGSYTATLRGKLADIYTVTPQFNGSAIGTLSDSITLTAGIPDGIAQSTFVASPRTITADNVATSTLTLTARDEYGNVIAGIASSLSVSVTNSLGTAPAEGSVTVSSVSETATPGVYTATLKGILADTYTVKPQANGNAIGTLSDTVSLTAGTPNGVKSAFSAAPDSIVADDVATSTLTLTAKDANGNAITGMAGSLSVVVTNSLNATPAEGKVTVSTVFESTTQPGTYTATLRGKLADTYTVKPQFSGSNIGTLSDTVTLTAGIPDGGLQSTFVASPHAVAADNTETSTLTLTTKDQYGNVITGIASSLSLTVTDSLGATPEEGRVTLSALTESSTGIYTATLKGTHADTYTLKPLLNGNNIGSLSDTVTLTAGAPDGVHSAFTTAPKSIVADDIAVSTMTFSAKDANDNVITGIARSLSIVVKDSHDATPQEGDVIVSEVIESATPGIYTATLRGKLAGTYTVEPQFNHADIGSLGDSVTLTAGVPDTGSTTTFVASPRSIAADNAETSTLTLTVKDKFGNVISGIAANLTLEVKDSEGAAPETGKVTVTSLVETGSTGIYTATLKGSLAGNWIVKPRYNSMAMGNLGDTVTLTAGVPDGAKSAFAAAPTSIVADDVTTSTLTFTAKDVYNNAISGIASSLSVKVSDGEGNAPAEGKVTVSGMTESATPGIYTATLRGKLAGDWTVKPQYLSLIHI